MGALRKTEDLEDMATYLKLKAIVDDYESRGADLDLDIVNTMNKFI